MNDKKEWRTKYKNLIESPLEEQYGPKSKQELDEMKMPYEDFCKAVFAPGHEMGKPEALKGTRFMSTTMYIFTPHSCANLAELGAEVYKFEMPRMGDPMKHTSPFNEAYLYPLHDTRPMTGTGYGFTSANINEYYVSIDYHIEAMKEPFYRIVKMSDGLVECYRPGTFDRWKQSYRYLAEMNPRFIYVWGGGFGYGPKVFGGSYDILGQAHAGLASVTGMHEFMGGHCAKHSNWCIDWYSGTQITFGVLAAMHWRRKTGLGTMIEFSQVQAATRVLGHAAPLYGRFGIVRQRWGNWDTQLCVHGIILCGKSDYPDAINPQDKFEARYAMVSAFQDADFKALCEVIKKPDMYSKYIKHKDRVGAEAQVDIYATLEDWAKDKSRAEVVRILQNEGLLAEPVMNDREVYENPHYRTRGTLRWMDDPLFGDVLVQGTYSAGLMSKTPRRQVWIWRPVGADNVKFYHELLGYPISQVKEWYDKAWI
ncbi:MAG: CoA transferase [Syntrophales bacterium]|nr:CoA transferase [Syntrophales bacterium]MDD5642913.1 CoA transferase [Syntrophales bacterium]